MNNKGKLNKLVIFLIIFVIISMTFTIFVIYKSYFEDHPCLEKIAKEECKDMGLYYDSIGWDFNYKFYCNKHERKSSFERFKFLPEELEHCSQKDRSGK